MLSHKLKYIIIIFLLPFTFPCFSQIRISGTITDSIQKPIPSASVTLVNIHDNLIVAFYITNKKGNYSIVYNHSFIKDSFIVKVNCIGYKAQFINISSPEQIVDFSLSTTSINLPNVSVVNNRPFLKLKVDTLSYNVDSFKNKQDRTIGDVLKKMPGIEVSDDGKILYNGKHISNFYIDGDNLLDDKYNLATNSISADMVDKVQVLENHQPIKVLKGVTISDKVGLNLSLKDKAKLKVSGHAEFGGGIMDQIIYDETINALAFKSKYKAINSYKTNNSGIDVSDDIISHNIFDFNKQLDNDVPNSLLNISTSGTAGVKKNRYLFNNAGIINTNNLFKTKNEIQFKTNIYYLFDKQEQYYRSNSFYYLPTDTIQYYEKQNSDINIKNLHAQLNINANKQKYYLNVTILTDINNRFSASALTTQNSLLTQGLSQKLNNFSNELNLIKTLKGKNVIEGYSYFNYVTQPEKLNIQPGINEFILNNSTSYLQLSQTSRVPTFFTNSYVTFRHPVKHLLQTYKIGISGQWQQLISDLSATQNINSVNIISNSFVNHTKWNHLKIYEETTYDWIANRTHVSISIPANFQYIQYIDTVQHINYKKARLFFNPSINLKIITGQENYLTASYSFNNRLGNIENVYKGYILNNYRSLSNYDIKIPLTNSHNIILGYSFKKISKILFFNVLATYSFNKNNSIIENSFFANILKQTTKNFDNSVDNFLIITSINKYIFKLRSTVALKSTFQKSRWNQLESNSLLEYDNISKYLSASINSKISNWFNFSYNISYSISQSKSINSINSASVQNTTQIVQTSVINILPTNRFFITLRGENYFIHQNIINNRTHYYFIDASVLLKYNKINLSLDLTNIANTKEFVNITQSGNNLTSFIYSIRQRMLILKAIFNF